MTTLEIILSACFFGLMVVWWGERTLRREAIDGWDGCIEKLLRRSRENSELRAKMVAFAMRNEDLENQISAIQSRRYEGN